MSRWSDLPTSGDGLATLLRQLADRAEQEGAGLDVGEMVELHDWLGRWSDDGCDRTEATYRRLQRKRTVLGYRAAQIDASWWLDPIERFTARLPVVLDERSLRKAQRDVVASHTRHMARVADLRNYVLDQIERATT